MQIQGLWLFQILNETCFLIVMNNFLDFALMEVEVKTLAEAFRKSQAWSKRRRSCYEQLTLLVRRTLRWRKCNLFENSLRKESRPKRRAVKRAIRSVLHQCPSGIRDLVLCPASCSWNLGQGVKVSASSSRVKFQHQLKVQIVSSTFANLTGY